MGQFSNDLLKRYVAPAIDVRPKVQLDDLDVEFSQAAYWTQNYFLNSVFGPEFTGDAARYASSYIARVQIVFRDYQVARTRTIAYANGWQSGAPNIGRYLYAIGEWEPVFINLQIVLDIIHKWMGAIRSESYDRTHQIANRIKHVSEDIRDNKIPEPGLPLWITETGFATINQTLAFVEMTEQIRLFAKIADALSNPGESKLKIADIMAERS